MEKNDAFLKTFPFVWVVTIIGGILLWVFVDQTWGVGYILGSATSLMMMSLLFKSSKNIILSDKLTAQKLAVRNYAFRYFFYAVILVAAGLLENIELIATVIGIFIFKIVFYIILFITKEVESK